MTSNVKEAALTPTQKERAKRDKKIKADIKVLLGEGYSAAETARVISKEYSITERYAQMKVKDYLDRR